MWNLYPFTHPNSGLTPPYARTPSTSGGFPFYPPWAKPTGGTGMVPFNELFPATIPQQGTSVVPYDNTPKLPAVRSSNPLVKSGVGGLSGILDMLRPLVGPAAVKGAQSFLGPLATGLYAAGQVMNPTPMGSEAPLYTKDAQGNIVPNTANPIVASMLRNKGAGQMTPVADITSPPVPLPQPGPVPLPQPRPHMTGSPVPLPRLRPQMPDNTNYYYGPGAMNFGVEGPSGNTFGQGPGLLSSLFGK